MSEYAIIENVIKQLRTEAESPDGTECNWINAAKIRAADKIEAFLKLIRPPKVEEPNVLFNIMSFRDAVLKFAKNDPERLADMIDEWRKNKIKSDSKRLETIIRSRIANHNMQLELMRTVDKGNIDPNVLDEILCIINGDYEIRPRHVEL